MQDPVASPSSAGYRFPPGIVAHAVWRHFRFPPRCRDVEEPLAERGVIPSYATVRQWCRGSGPTDANALRRHRPRPGDMWHLDEVFVAINGVRHDLWRACLV